MWGAREMGYRVVFWDCLWFLVWALVCFILLKTFGFNILLSSLGVVFGLVYGITAVQWYIKGIEKNGEFRATRKMWAFLLLAIIVIVPLAVYSGLSFGLAGARQMISFVYPILLAFIATRIGLILNLERKQKKHILSKGFWILSLYTSPETEKK